MQFKKEPAVVFANNSRHSGVVTLSQFWSSYVICIVDSSVAFSKYQSIPLSSIESRFDITRFPDRLGVDLVRDSKVERNVFSCLLLSGGFNTLIVFVFCLCPHKLCLKQDAFPEKNFLSICLLCKHISCQLSSNFSKLAVSLVLFLDTFEIPSSQPV